MSWNPDDLAVGAAVVVENYGIARGLELREVTKLTRRSVFVGGTEYQRVNGHSRSKGFARPRLHFPVTPEHRAEVSRQRLFYRALSLTEQVKDTLRSNEKCATVAAVVAALEEALEEAKVSHD